MWMDLSPQMTVGIFGIQLIVIFLLALYGHSESQENEKILEENKDLKKRLGRD